VAKQQYKAAEVIDALKRARGIKAVAAKILGCDRRTVERYCNRYVTVERACKDAREMLIDIAEGKLASHVDKGDWPAVKWTLATIGKQRGYVERQEVTGAEGGALDVRYVDDWRDKAAGATSGPAGGEPEPGAVQVAGSGAALAQDDAGDGDSS